MSAAAVQSPLSGHRQRSSRKALQPKINTIPNTVTSATEKNAVSKPTQCVHISNKENIHPMIQSFDSSLAQELSAIREKLERLRIDKENTDKVMRQRSVMLDSQMKDILNRWEDQKQLEMEVDRLYRLKEIRLYCMRVSPVKSLRDKEQERVLKERQLKDEETRREEQTDEGPLPSGQHSDDK